MANDLGRALKVGQRSGGLDARIPQRIRASFSAAVCRVSAVTPDALNYEAGAMMRI